MDKEEKWEREQNTRLLCKEHSDKRKEEWQENNKGKDINIKDFVKIAITDNEGTEHLWFEIFAISEKPSGKFYIGRCDNNPILVNSIKFGDIRDIKFEEIEEYLGN